MGKKVETVADVIFLGSKITSDGDCSHEIKRRLLLGRKAAYQPRQHSSVHWLSHVWIFQPHGLKHARLLRPSATPRAYSDSCSSSWWCHPLPSPSLPTFSHSQNQGLFQRVSCLHSGGQSIGGSASASVLPMNIQDWFPLGWTGWISLQSKGLQVQSVRIQLNAGSPSWYPENCLVVWGKFHTHNWNWVQNSK